MSAEYSVEEALTMIDRIAIAYGSQELEDARAVLAERIKAGEGVVVEVCIPFGHGKVVVTTGKHGGVPCVYLAPASMPGVVGESAARENLPRDKRVPGESILTFPTAEQAAIVAAALCGKSVHPPAQAAQDADWRIGMFDRWNEAAKEKGYAGICEAINATPTAEPAAQKGKP